VSWVEVPVAIAVTLRFFETTAVVLRSIVWLPLGVPEPPAVLVMLVETRIREEGFEYGY
jgi:hypothetical protein